MKRNLKNVLKKTVAWMLAIAMVAGCITFYPSTEASADEDEFDGVVTVHVYYPDYATNGTPAISLYDALYDSDSNEIEADFTYYGRNTYFMTADEENGDGWFTFEFTTEDYSEDYESYIHSGFQLLASSTGNDAVWDDSTSTGTDDTTFIANVGIQYDSTGYPYDLSEIYDYTNDDVDNVYLLQDLIETLSCEISDLYLSLDLLDLNAYYELGVEDYIYGSCLSLAVFADEFTDEGYYLDWNEENSYTSIEAVVKNYETYINQDYLSYWIGGCLWIDDGTTYGDYNSDGGIFSDAYSYEQMEETDEEGVYVYKSVNTTELGELYYVEAYGSTTTSSDDIVWSKLIDTSFTAVIDGAYIMITYYSESGYCTIGYYEDADCTVEAEAATTTLYFYYTGSLTPYACFTSVVAGDPDGYYWQRYAYEMTEDSSNSNWYTFELKSTYGDLQVVAYADTDEVWTCDDDGDDSTWLANITDDTYSSINFDNDINVYYRGLIFESIDDALSYDDWTYYISGSNSDYDLESEYLGTSNNIFSNYWSKAVGRDDTGETDDDGNAVYEYWEDTTEDWQDVFTDNGDGSYTVTMPNKAVTGTTYAFNIYIEKDWNEAVYSSAETFTALADGYVQITFYKSTEKYEITYLDDDGEDITPEEETIRFYVYYVGDSPRKLTIVFLGNQVNDLDSSERYSTYWGNDAYQMTAYSTNAAGKGWYYFDIKASYGSFQIVANPQGESEDDGITGDYDGTVWYCNVYDDDYAAVLAGSTWRYRGKFFTSQAKALAETDWDVYISGAVSVDSEPDDEDKYSMRGIFSNYWSTSSTPSYYTDDDGNEVAYYEEEWLDQMSGSFESGTLTYKATTKATKGKSYTFSVIFEQSWSDVILKQVSFTAAYSGYIKITVTYDVSSSDNSFSNASYSIKYYTDSTFSTQKQLSKPTNLTVKSAGTTAYGKVKLSWSKVSYAEKYYVYANGKKVATTTSTSYTYTKATAGSSVKYTVKAVASGFATSAASSSKTIMVPKAVTKSKVTISRTTAGYVKLTWTKVSSASGYLIQRSTKSSSGFKTIKTITSNSTKTYTDKNSTVKKGTKVYYYRIIPYKKYTSSGTTVRVLAKNAITVSTPKRATIKSVKNVSGKKAKITWKKLSSVSGYQVMYATNKSFTKNKKTKAVSSSKTSLTVTGLKKGKTYYFKVRSYKKLSNGKKSYGRWSTVKKVKISK